MLFGLAGGLFAQPNLLATIRRDVQTDFATYHPFLVTIAPQADAYSVALDFSNVENFADFQFSEDQLRLLRENDFVVTAPDSNRWRSFPELTDIYAENLDRAIPSFVTSDAMLHTLHLMYGHLLQEAERHYPKKLARLAFFYSVILNRTFFAASL